MIGSKCGALQNSATHWSLALKTHTCFYHQQQVVTVTAGDTSFNLKIVLCVFAVVSSKTCFMNVGRFQQTESSFVCDSCFLAHVAHSSCNMMTKVSRFRLARRPPLRRVLVVPFMDAAQWDL